MSLANAIKTRADDARETLNTSTEQVIDKGAAAIASAEDKAKDAGQAALDEISALVATLNDKVAALGVDTSRLADKAKTTYADLETYMSREVSERPMRTLAFVGLAGLALGLLTRK